MKCYISKDALSAMVHKIRTEQTHSTTWYFSFQEDGIHIAFNQILAHDLPLYNCVDRCNLSLHEPILDALLSSIKPTPDEEECTDYFTFSYTTEYNSMEIGHAQLNKTELHDLQPIYTGKVCDFSASCDDLNYLCEEIERCSTDNKDDINMLKEKYECFALERIRMLYNEKRRKEKKYAAVAIPNKYAWQTPVWESILTKTMDILPQTRVQTRDDQKFMFFPIMKLRYINNINS